MSDRPLHHRPRGRAPSPPTAPHAIPSGSAGPLPSLLPAAPTRAEPPATLDATVEAAPIDPESGHDPTPPVANWHESSYLLTRGLEVRELSAREWGITARTPASTDRSAAGTRATSAGHPPSSNAHGHAPALARSGLDPAPASTAPAAPERTAMAAAQRMPAQRDGECRTPAFRPARPGPSAPAWPRGDAVAGGCKDAGDPTASG